MCPTGTSSLTKKNSRKSDLRSAFDVLDVDRDGKISRDDLWTFYREYSQSISSSSSEEDNDVIGTMISVADANKDGFVEYDEFEKVLESSSSRMNNGGITRRRTRRNSLMEDAFKVMDKDGDGKVGHEDLKGYLRSAGFNDTTDDDVKAMIRLAGGDDIDQNGGGGVTYENLVRILAL